MSISTPIQLNRPGTPLTLRGRVWLHRRRLDERLATGASPSSSPELSRRADQLASLHCRRGIAAGLERVLEAANEPPRGHSASVPVARREILANAGLIQELANDLRQGDRVNARGVAMVERLLTDGGSPLYAACTTAHLEEALRHARSALLLA